jgi:hypothetical protein
MESVQLRAQRRMWWVMTTHAQALTPLAARRGGQIVRAQVALLEWVEGLGFPLCGSWVVATDRELYSHTTWPELVPSTIQGINIAPLPRKPSPTFQRKKPRSRQPQLQCSGLEINTGLDYIDLR